MKIKKGQLRIWHIPQIPMEDFKTEVDNPKEAKKILEILANYDIFQFERKIKPNYSNAAGLEEFDGKEWSEWHDEEGNEINNTILF